MELQSLREPVENGMHTLLTTQRRMGKTSLVRELLRRLDEESMKDNGQNGWSVAAWFQGMTIVAKGKPAGALAAELVFVAPVGLALWLIEDDALKMFAILILGMFGLIAFVAVLAFLGMGSGDE